MKCTHFLLYFTLNLCTVCLRLHPKPFSLLTLYFTSVSSLSAGSLIWNYFVTMPMPASTFTLAVGHWCQVTTQVPTAFDSGVSDRLDGGSKPGPWVQNEAGPSLGRSSSEAVKGSTVQTGRYFIIFPVFFFCH